VQPGLFFSLILVIWLWLDFNGLLMSVIATYFFFGMEGAPLLELTIGLVAVLTFSGPAFYWLLLLRRNVRWEFELLTGLQAGIYLFCALVRDSDVFAWTIVFGRFVSGVAIVSLLRRIRDFSNYEIPALGFLIAFTVYLWARIAGDGLLLAIRPTSISAAMLIGLFILAMALRRTPAAAPVRAERADRSLQVSTIAFALLIDVGFALLYNFNLWSASTPWAHASVYAFSFGLGTAGGFLVARHLAPRRSSLPLLLASGAAAMGLGLYVVLHLSYRLDLGLLAHAAGCYGLTVFWVLFVRRFKHHLDRKPGALPIAGMQASNLISLMVLTHFLMTAIPSGFWLAFGIGVPLLAAVEVRMPIREGAPLSTRRATAWLALFLVPMLPALFYLTSPGRVVPQAIREPNLSVMTTNARYGWTDDYRFEPEPYLRWLQGRPADIIGMQEVNKGNFYASFADLFQYYRARLPGDAIYGDASFGFGNALFTSLELRESRIVAFREGDMIRRSFVWALVEHRGREIEVFVTHLSHLPHPNPVRQAQVAELIEWLQRSERPWILMGDLNARPDAPEIAALLEVAHPVFRERSELLAELTHPSIQPKERIDYVFFSPHFDLVEQEVLDHGGTTDHRPVRSVLKLVR
jgi:endonuclease/exonuclease/phosphatase family metal-dependent hydrolase